MEELLHQLHIEPKALLINIVGFVVVLWVLKRTAFGPVGDFIAQRKERIAADLDQAEADREGAAAERADITGRREHMLQEARAAAEGVTQDAARDADEARSAARETARDIQKAARQAIERERQEAASQLRDSVGETAVTMCRRILREALDEQRQKAMVDEFIGDVERLAADSRPTE